MRVSVKNSDPGYFEGSYRCTVYLALHIPARRSIIAAMMIARRARRRRAMATQEDEGVHRAISAFNRAGAERRANEL